MPTPKKTARRPWTPAQHRPRAPHPPPKPLGNLKDTFTQDYFKQWLEKHDLKEKLQFLKATGPLTVKRVREYLDGHGKLMGWAPDERRRWKRAAIWIIKQL